MERWKTFQIPASSDSDKCHIVPSSREHSTPVSIWRSSTNGIVSKLPYCQSTTLQWFKFSLNCTEKVTTCPLIEFRLSNCEYIREATYRIGIPIHSKQKP